jgi:hypothetical protein
MQENRRLTASGKQENHHMHLTRTGWHAVASIYLIPLVFIGIIGNSTATGAESEFYYWSTLFCGLLAAYAVISMFAGGETMSAEAAQRAKNHPTNDVVSFDKLHSLEFAYDAVLCLVAVGMFFYMHKINKDTTGGMSLVSMIWSYFSLAIAGLSGWQFWGMKSGQIVQVTRKLVN